MMPAKEHQEQSQDIAPEHLNNTLLREEVRKRLFDEEKAGYSEKNGHISGDARASHRIASREVTSSASTIAARKAKLKLEAAEAKARIDKQLIEIQLEAEMAALEAEEENSSEAEEHEGTVGSLERKACDSGEKISGRMEGTVYSRERKSVDEIGMYAPSQKRHKFLEGPISFMPVDILPGVGSSLAGKLKSAGFYKADLVLDKYLQLGQDRKKFKDWIMEFGANRMQIDDLYKSLTEYYKNNILKGRSNGGHSESAHFGLREKREGTSAVNISLLHESPSVTKDTCKNDNSASASNDVFMVPPKDKMGPVPKEKNESPQVKMSSRSRQTTSQKHRTFVAEPIAGKSVRDLPGVGRTLGQRLDCAGVDKADQVLGQYLVMGQDKGKFQGWMKEKCGANSKQSADTYEGLREYHSTFIGNGRKNGRRVSVDVKVNVD